MHTYTAKIDPNKDEILDKLLEDFAFTADCLKSSCEFLKNQSIHVSVELLPLRVDLANREYIEEQMEHINKRFNKLNQILVKINDMIYENQSSGDGSV